MSTNSRIGIRNKDGSIESIYCHWDGYPSHQAPLLLTYYSKESRVRDLIALGDLSSLEKYLNPTEPHSFDHPQDNVCVAYCRDRGESVQGTCPYMSKNTTEYKHDLLDGVPFHYLFDVKSNEWKLFQNAKFTKLTMPD